MANNAGVIIILCLVLLAGGGAALYFLWLKPMWDDDDEEEEEDVDDGELSEDEEDDEEDEIDGTFNYTTWKKERRHLGPEEKIPEINALEKAITELESQKETMANKETSIGGLKKKFAKKALEFTKDQKRIARESKNFNFNAWKKARKKKNAGKNRQIDAFIKNIQKAKSKNMAKLKPKKKGSLPWKHYDAAIAYLETLKTGTNTNTNNNSDTNTNTKNSDWCKLLGGNFDFAKWKSKKQEDLKNNNQIQNLIDRIKEAQTNEKDRLTTGGLPCGLYPEALEFLRGLKTN